MVTTRGFIQIVNWAMVVWGFIFIIACASEFFFTSNKAETHISSALTSIFQTLKMLFQVLGGKVLF
jgi:hypothetical protein